VDDETSTALCRCRANAIADAESGAWSGTLADVAATASGEAPTGSTNDTPTATAAIKHSNHPRADQAFTARLLIPANGPYHPHNLKKARKDQPTMEYAEGINHQTRSK
jgi:hypothetical protein